MKMTVVIISKKTFETKTITGVTSITISSRRWAIKVSSTTYYATDDYQLFVLGVTE